MQVPAPLAEVCILWYNTLSMKIIIGILYYTLQWTWGIVQNLIGLFMWLLQRVVRRTERHGRFRFAAVTGWNRKGSMGMGMFMFTGKSISQEDIRVPKPGTYEEHILSHEYGHTVQSAILGPFYLPVIGVPSFIWCNFRPVAKRWKSGKKDYEGFYPERWANHLGLKTEARHLRPGVQTTKPENTASV